jgi:hypothetical protein
LPPCGVSRSGCSGAESFVLLVKIFGKDILYAVPEVSVTRLDGVKLEDLVKLETGSVETNRVTRILARIKS